MKKIVVVEDDISILDLYVEILTLEGYEVEAARSGKEALEILSRTNRLPCLVLTDFMMPEMNGGELIELIKKEDVLMSLPVVVASAEPKIQEKVGSGIDFLKKPLELDAIINKVKEYCGPAKYEQCPPKSEKLKIAQSEPHTAR